MKTAIQRAVLAASFLAVLMGSGCASIESSLHSTQTPVGDVEQPGKPGSDPLLQQMSEESQRS